MARRNCAMSLRRADGRRQKAHLATAITIRRYMRPRYAVLVALVVCGFCYDGAGGMVGSARVAKAAPDGYQFVLGSRADAINQTLYKNPLYNFAADLAPVVLIADQPTLLVARKDLPADNLQEFIAYAKANQATMQMASAGAGSTGHLDCMLLNAAIGINVTHVPYRGGGPAMQDLIAGRIDYFCTLSATAKQQIEGKLVKAIAILSRDRSSMLPE